MKWYSGNGSSVEVLPETTPKYTMTTFLAGNPAVIPHSISHCFLLAKETHLCWTIGAKSNTWRQHACLTVYCVREEKKISPCHATSILLVRWLNGYEVLSLSSAISQSHQPCLQNNQSSRQFWQESTYMHTYLGTYGVGIRFVKKKRKKTWM